MLGTGETEMITNIYWALTGYHIHVLSHLNIKTKKALMTWHGIIDSQRCPEPVHMFHHLWLRYVTWQGALKLKLPMKLRLIGWAWNRGIIQGGWMEPFILGGGRPKSWCQRRRLMMESRWEWWDVRRAWPAIAPLEEGNHKLRNVGCL